MRYAVCVASSADPFASYVRAHRERDEQAQRELPTLRESARNAARAAAERIGARTQARRVLLFGSLARGTFRVGSDIDLAVEGLPAGQLVDALAAAEDGCPLPIDVLPLEATRPDIADSIRTQGELLWQR